MRNVLVAQIRSHADLLAREMRHIHLDALGEGVVIVWMRCLIHPIGLSHVQRLFIFLKIVGFLRGWHQVAAPLIVEVVIGILACVFNIYLGELGKVCRSPPVFLLR